MSESVMAALSLAAAGASAPAQAVGVDALLDALGRTDPVGDWSRVALHLSDAVATDRAPVVGSYEGIPLTRQVCAGLEGARKVMEAYGFPVLLPGLVAVALLHGLTKSPPVSSAAPADIRAALSAVFDDVLGGDLPELDAVLGRAASERTHTGAGTARFMSDRLLETPRALLHEATELADDAGDPGACHLLAAAVHGVERLDQLCTRIGVLDPDDCSSARLEGLPEVAAAAVLERAARARGSRRRADVVYTGLVEPSWRVWEMLARRAVRPLDLAVAMAIEDPERPLGLLAYLNRGWLRMGRLVLWVWVAYMVIRHRDFAALVALFAPKAWALDVPPVASLAISFLVLRSFGWVPGGIGLAMTALGLLTVRSERRSLRAFLGVAVPASAYRRALHLDGRGSLSFLSWLLRVEATRREGLAP